ncbi:partial Tol-Pal system protein TolB, partial [Anaerolineae bacterium]
MPAWSPDGKQIAFIAYVHGSPEVYVMNDKGKKLQRLTADSAADADPVWSPDGTRVLFTSNRGGTPWLYTVRADGSALSRLPLPTRITGAHQGDWSRDGRIIFSLWGQAPASPAKMSADAPAPATLVYSPTPTPTEPAMAVMSAPEAVTGYNRTLSYEYDSLYRLTGATYTEGTSVSEYAYGYDLRGNRTSVTAPGVGTFTYPYNLANQITNGGFSYDLNGNLKTDGTLTYQYDAANRLHKVSRGTEHLEYFYNGSGDRYAHTLNMGEAHTSVNYLLDPSGSLSRVLQETMDTPGDDWVNTYLYGLGVLGQQNGSTWSTFGTDPLGSVRFLLDSSGDPTSRADYDPYGVPLPVPGQESGMPSALGFTG